MNFQTPLQQKDILQRPHTTPSVVPYEHTHEPHTPIRRVTWSLEECVALRDGLLKFGLGHWRSILTDPDLGPVFQHKSNMDMSNRWRSLMANQGTRVPKKYKSFNDQKLLLQLSLDAANYAIEDKSLRGAPILTEQKQAVFNKMIEQQKSNQPMSAEQEPSTSTSTSSSSHKRKHMDNIHTNVLYRQSNTTNHHHHSNTNMATELRLVKLPQFEDNNDHNRMMKLAMHRLISNNIDSDDDEWFDSYGETKINIDDDNDINITADEIKHFFNNQVYLNDEISSELTKKLTENDLPSSDKRSLISSTIYDALEDDKHGEIKKLFIKQLLSTLRNNPTRVAPNPTSIVAQPPFHSSKRTPKLLNITDYDSLLRYEVRKFHVYNNNNNNRNNYHSSSTHNNNHHNQQQPQPQPTTTCSPAMYHSTKQQLPKHIQVSTAQQKQAAKAMGPLSELGTVSSIDLVGNSVVTDVNGRDFDCKGRIFYKNIKPQYKKLVRQYAATMLKYGGFQVEDVAKKFLLHCNVIVGGRSLYNWKNAEFQENLVDPLTDELLHIIPPVFSLHTGECVNKQLFHVEDALHET